MSYSAQRHVINRDPEGDTDYIAKEIIEWCETDFEPGSWPDFVLIPEPWRGDEAMADLRKKLEIKYIKPLPAPPKTASAGVVYGLWWDGQHKKVKQLRENVDSLKHHIQLKHGVWEEAERIKRIHDGEMTLTLRVGVPRKVSSYHVTSGRENLDEAQETGLLVQVGNESHAIEFGLRVMCPPEQFGYNHNLMQAIHYVSGPLKTQIEGALEGMVHKMLRDVEEDRKAKQARGT